MPTTALKRVAENGEVVWNLRALDWPLRSTAKRETVDGVRKAVLEYLDWMGRMSLDRTSSQIRREVSRGDPMAHLMASGLTGQQRANRMLLALLMAQAGSAG